MGAAVDTEFTVTTPKSNGVDKNGDVLVSFSDTVFGFWEDLQAPPENSSDSDDDREEDQNQSLSNKAFWEQQYHLLQATLCRSSWIETRVGEATKEGLREMNMADRQCICRPKTVVVESCRNCLRREICNRLLNLGYNCAVSTSKWRTSQQIQISGEHTYLEVMHNTKKGEVKVVIELNFRGEFEMARANEEYNKLINELPEVFAGKAERLRVIISIMCSAAKKCMKEKKMHLGPWRKQRYMQAKWLGITDKAIITTLPLPMVYSSRPPKPKASMLTCDLLETISGLHCAVRC